MALSKSSKYKLNQMEGMEVLSPTFEGCVGIRNGEVIREGKVLPVDNVKIDRLWEEAAMEGIW